MNCFIHKNNESVGFCKVCKRPICKVCMEKDNGVCPRCSNFTHKTIFNYNKKIVLFLSFGVILRILFWWDTFILTFFGNVKLEISSTGFIVLSLLFIPFIINIIKYDIKQALIYQVFGRRDAIIIADNKKWKNIKTWILGIVIFIVLSLLSIFITPIFIVTDLIHLFFCVKDLIYHGRRILSEDKIRNLK